MKKALLTACLTAALVTAPLVGTDANAAEPINPIITRSQPQLRISAEQHAAYLLTASGNVTVQWGQQDGPGAKHDGYFFVISRTHPSVVPVIIKTNRAGRNAIIATLRADRKQLAAGAEPFASTGKFVKSIVKAGKTR